MPDPITSYEDLSNKPTINGVELTGNMSLEDIGIHELPQESISELALEIFGAIL